MNNQQQRMPAILVMGVTACGKSTIAAAIARRAGGTHIEGDQYHSAASIEKMRAGIALDDADRHAWLQRLGVLIGEAVAAGQRPVLSCSALKREYRERLRSAVPKLEVVFLEIDKHEVRRRVARRRGHFMSGTLVDSQFETLQSPVGESGALAVDATLPVAEISRSATDWWQAHGE